MPKPTKITIIIESEKENLVTTFEATRDIHWETEYTEPDRIYVGLGQTRISPPEVAQMSLVFKPMKDDNGVLYTQEDLDITGNERPFK